MNNNKRHARTSITVLAALGIMCGTQEAHALEQKSSNLQFEQNSAVLGELMETEKHHHHHRKSHHEEAQDDLVARGLIKRPNMSIGGQSVSDAEAAAMGELAEKQAMDDVKGELNNMMKETGEKAESFLGEHPVEPDADEANKAQSLAVSAVKEEDEGRSSPQPIGSLIQKSRQKQMSADDYDDRDKEQAEQRGGPGSNAAAHIIAMQKEAKEREEKEEKEAAKAQEELREAVAQKAEEERQHMMDAKAETPHINKSASSLANELQDSMYKPINTNPTKTANLIAQAILHQKQKQAGIEEEPKAAPEPVHSFAEQRHVEAEEAPKTIVTKDELIESQQMKPLSFQENSAKNNAVQSVLAKLKAGHSSSALSGSTSSFSSTPTISSTPSLSAVFPKIQTQAATQSSSSSSEASKAAVQHMIEMMKQKKAAAQAQATPTPEVTASPVPQQPEQHAQPTQEAPKRELTTKEKEEQEKKEEKMAQEQAEAEMEAMNSVEELQHKAQAKQQGKEPEPQPKKKETEPVSDAVQSLESSASKIPVGSPAEATLQKSIEEMKVPQQLPSFTAAPITQPLVQHESTAQRGLIDKILKANKNFNVMGPSVTSPTSFAPLSVPQPSVSSQSAQENAVQKTLASMGFGTGSKPSFEAPKSSLETSSKSEISKIDFGVSGATPVPSTALAPTPAPAPIVPTIAPPATPENPMIMQSPQAPVAHSSSSLNIETSTLAVPQQVAAKPAPVEQPVQEIKPKVVEKPKPKEVKKDESPSYSIETTKLDVDEKDLGIKSAQIPQHKQEEEKKPLPAPPEKEKKLKSKKADSDTPSFTIETTTMEADPESLVQPKAPAPAQPKPQEVKVEKKVEKILKKKPVQETSDFKIETSTVSPEMMKALAGDDEDEKPAPPKAPEPAKVQAVPQVAKQEVKKAGIQGAQPIDLSKQAPKETPKEAPKESPKEAPKESNEVTDVISGVFGEVPEAPKKLADTSSSVQVDDYRLKNQDGNLKAKVQDLVKTIQPALAAMGSENHATVQIVIKDNEDDVKKDEVKKEEVKKEDKKVEEHPSSFIKSKEDPPKMAHPSTTSPPMHLTHSQIPAPPSIVPMPSVSPDSLVTPSPILAPKVDTFQPSEFLKKDSFNTTNPLEASSPQPPISTQQKVADILSAVSKASQNQQSGQPAQQFNVTLVMPSGQPATPVSTTSASPVVTSEQMSAVANSIQLEKLQDQEKHQNAVSKTLALALKAKEVEDKKKEALQAKQNAEMLEEIAKQKKQAEEDQKKHDDLIQRTIQLAKAQNPTVSKDQVVAKAIEQGRASQASNEHKSNSLKDAILAKSKNKVVAAPAAPEKTNEEKAMELAAQMTAQNPQNALKMLEKEDNEQKAPSSGSLQSDIVAKTIALAKAKQDKEEHPLAAGLFGALQVQTGIENTALPDEKTLSKLDADTTKSSNKTINSTVLAASNKTETKSAVKNEGKVANKSETTSVNASSVKNTNVTINKSAKTNATAVKSNTIVAVQTNSTTKVNTSEKASANVTAKVNVSKPANKTFVQFDFEIQAPEDVDALALATSEPTKKNINKMHQKSATSGLEMIINKVENKIESALHKMF